jgi:hypothetical protein
MNPKVHYRVHNSSQTASTCSLINPGHAIPTYFLIPTLILSHYLPPGLPRVPLLSHFFFYPYLSHAPPIYCPWFYHVNNILWRIPTTKIFICSFLHHFPVTSCLLRITVFLGGLFSNTLSLYFSVNVRDQVPHPFKKLTKLQSIRDKWKKWNNKLHKVSAPPVGNYCMPEVCLAGGLS